MPGKADVSTGIEGVAEGNVKLLLQRSTGVARSLVSAGNTCVHLFTANFRNEPQHLARGTVNAHIDKIAEASKLLVFSEAATGDDAEVRGVIPGVSPNENRELLYLLSKYAHCFATLSKDRQTPVA